MQSITYDTTRANRIRTPSAPKPVVFVVDDEPADRKSVEQLIGTEGWQAETFTSAAVFLSQPRPTAPFCLILDASVRTASGLELQRQLVERTRMPIIVMSRLGDVTTTVQAMKAGAFDVLEKPIDSSGLRVVIGAALERSRAIQVEESELSSLRARYTSLTRREADVMRLVVSGLLNKQVGGELGICEITVKAHRGQVMRKMNADSLPALVTMAARLGVLSLRVH
jgi:FixJ family two-component response regulator